ncbi:hypothetical protein GWI33_019641 [Rhynchophorus ferrugineus]|uniref:Uncharacterized protein n=1 Tax=Rhynchophorus ferrugineus TaxID=354439 RepID=A0A834HTB5_RHYFE|nr:hypothetical protein GWI33_019641 [Rhynchophorus ferrugineus]
MEMVEYKAIEKDLWPIDPNRPPFNITILPFAALHQPRRPPQPPESFPTTGSDIRNGWETGTIYFLAGRNTIPFN